MRLEILHRARPACEGDFAGRIVVWKPEGWAWTSADLGGGRAVAVAEVGEAMLAELEAGRLMVSAGALVPLPEELSPAGEEEV
jgi:hypothetical protein